MVSGSRAGEAMPRRAIRRRREACVADMRAAPPARRPAPASRRAIACASGACDPGPHPLPALRARRRRRRRARASARRPAARRAGRRWAESYAVAFRSDELWAGDERPGRLPTCSRATWSRRTPTMEHDHDEHGHHHAPPTSAVALRARALEALLVEKGLVSTDAIDAVIELYETTSARRTARAWSRAPGSTRPTASGCCADGARRSRELGYGGDEGTRWSSSRTRPACTTSIVCTLCSCYPWPVLGLPPTWYKSAPYRARVVAEPRAVLREFGLELADETSRCASGTRAPRCATSSCPSGPPGPRAERGRARRAGHARLDDRHRACRSPRRVTGRDRSPRSTRAARRRRCRARTASSSSRSRGRAGRSAWASSRSSAPDAAWASSATHLVAAIAEHRYDPAEDPGDGVLRGVARRARGAARRARRHRLTDSDAMTSSRPPSVRRERAAGGDLVELGALRVVERPSSSTWTSAVAVARRSRSRRRGPARASAAPRRPRAASPCAARRARRDRGERPAPTAGARTGRARGSPPAAPARPR